jgi:cytolethal distending toxin subunit B
MQIITWNMQGAGYPNEDKWNIVLSRLLGAANPPDAICLQECGDVPQSAQHNPVGAKVYTINGCQVFVYQWPTSDRFLPRYITFYPWDISQSSRVNMSVVTSFEPDKNQISLVWSQGVSHRPALGVSCPTILGKRTPRLWIYSFHAISPKGADAEDMIEAVNIFSEKDTYKQWLIAGDWNREPATLTGLKDAVISPPNQATYSARTVRPISEYDYCVHNRLGSTPVIGNVLADIALSDHYPVVFELE